MKFRSEIIKILEELVGFDGVKASAVLSRDGLLMGYHNEDIPLEVLPSILAMMAKCAEKSVKILQEGDMDYILIKAEKGLILTQICPNFIISVITNPDMSVDIVLEEMNKARKRISGML